MKSTGLVFKSRSYIGSVEPPATVLEDESRYGNNGTFRASGEPNWVKNEAGFWVLDHDGSDDYVDIGAKITAGLPQITIIVWANPTDRSADYYILGDYNAPTDNSVVFGISDFASHGGTDETWRLYCSLKGDDSARIEPVADTEFAYGSWYQWAVTWDTVTYKAFVNAVQDDEVAYADAAGLEKTTTQNLAIGAYQPADNKGQWKGRILPIIIYDWAVPIEVIAANFQANRHWFGI